MHEHFSTPSNAAPPFKVLLVAESPQQQGSPWRQLHRHPEWELCCPQSPAELEELWTKRVDLLVFCSHVLWNAWEPVVASLIQDRPFAAVLLVTSVAHASPAFVPDNPLQWLNLELPEEMLLHTLRRTASQTRARRAQDELVSHLTSQNQQLEFQNKIISALQEVRLDSNQPFRECLAHIAEQLLPLTGMRGFRIRVRSSYLVQEHTLGLEGLALPWAGVPIPESHCSESPEGRLLSSEELTHSFPQLPLKGLQFFGYPLQENHLKLSGELGLYIDAEHAEKWTEDLLRLVSRKLTLLLYNQVAALETRQTYDTLMDLASFNRSLLTDFHERSGRELEHYRRTLDLLLTKESGDLQASHALLLRSNDSNDLRATPFHRNSQGRVVALAPTLKARHLEGLFPPNLSGFNHNLSPQEQRQQNSLFPRELTELVGSIRNYVYSSLQLKQGQTDTLVLFNYGRPVKAQDSALLMAFSLPLSVQIGFSRETKSRRRIQLVTMAKLAELAEKRDDETGAHLKRISHYSRVLAEDLAAGYSPYNNDIDAEFIREIYDSSPLHDIGKVGIADQILCKAGKLTDEEYEVMKTHTLIGAEVLEGVEFLKMAHDIALCHHEKFDGTGYPRGLMGEAIPLAARIVALADVYDAITSRRVYRQQPFTHEEAKSLLLREYGRHFDPSVVDAFLRCEQLFVKIREKYNPHEASNE